MKNILVIGDWVVDEHWVVGKHRSDTASRRGEAHYHALHDLDSSVEALSGAGMVASLLASTKANNDLVFRVHGVGAWNSDDQTTLEAMTRANGLDGYNRYTVTREAKPQRALDNTGVVHLHNICTTKVATTRVIRVYLEDHLQMKHLYRLDWEQSPDQDPRSHKGAWIQNSRQAAEWWKRQSHLESFSPHVIIVKDLVKGVVTDALLKQVIKAYPAGEHGPHWYISSKEWHLRPTGRDEWRLAEDTWLRHLVHQDVRLLFVPQVAAAAAQLLKNINSWRIASGAPSWQAMKLMDALGNALRFKGREPEVAVFPERSPLFLRTKASDSKALIVGEDSTKGSGDLVPVSSVLFASMVAMMEGDTIFQSARNVLPRASAFTALWVKKESERFTPPVWRPSTHDPIEIGIGKPPTARVKQTSWNDELTDWDQARRDLGILYNQDRARASSKPDYTIELWRAMTDVDGYIALTASKREAIRAIKRELRMFVQGQNANHVSMLLESEPGSGKTFLLDKLADELGLDLMPYNITRMTSMTNILDCFDEIVSRQSSAASSRPILAFFDEINALLDNSHIYGTFLDPIDRGTYTRSGRAFYIRPCAWVFAGTGMGNSAPETKGSDFRSRLTVPPLQFNSRGTHANDTTVRA